MSATTVVGMGSLSRKQETAPGRKPAGVATSQKVVLWRERVGFEPEEPVSAEVAQSMRNCAIPIRDNALPASTSQDPEQNSALSAHLPDTSAHPEHVRSMFRNLPPDLAEVVEAWDRLPEAIKAGIVAIVTAARGK